MTWVVGANSLFGKAFLISDIQITFGKGKNHFRDCCQKVHFLSPDVIGGFAGSVQIGFAVMERLKRELLLTNEHSSWILEDIANDWLSIVIKDEFDQFPSDQKKMGCQIIIAAAHPTKNRGDMPVPWTDVVKLSWPDFKPEFAPQAVCCPSTNDTLPPIV